MSMPTPDQIAEVLRQQEIDGLIAFNEERTSFAITAKGVMLSTLFQLMPPDTNEERQEMLFVLEAILNGLAQAEVSIDNSKLTEDQLTEDDNAVLIAGAALLQGDTCQPYGEETINLMSRGSGVPVPMVRECLRRLARANMVQLVAKPGR